MKDQKYNIDEMQERRLFQIEEIGFWLTFWASGAAVVIQAVLGADLRQIAGEGIVLLISSAYLVFATVRNGIWNKGGPAPTLRANALVSLIPAAACGAILLIRVLAVLKRPLTFEVAVVALAFAGVCYLGCLGALEILRAVYRKRRAKLDDEEEETA